MGTNVWACESSVVSIGVWKSDWYEMFNLKREITENLRTVIAQNPSMTLYEKDTTTLITLTHNETGTASGTCEWLHNIIKWVVFKLLRWKIFIDTFFFFLVTHTLRSPLGLLGYGVFVLKCKLIFLVDISCVCVIDSWDK